MPERELERVMRDFVAQRYNVLLCSTIIETGIDVPTANTIVISRADKFGLAQLHQLRGRVGRSHHQAYAYLLVPDVEGLSKAAAQRLEAIQQMEELGSGFYLAMHDLEIRGAGEVLGEHQSGNMMEIGFQLYNDMLAEAVRSLKAGREPDLLSPLAAITEINLHAPALLPDAYCGDVHTRLNLYKRLASADKTEQIDTLLEEITDRFGKLPAQGQTLFDTHRLRVLAKPYGVVKIDAAPRLAVIAFRPNPPIDALRIIELVQKNRHIKLAGNDKLRIEREMPRGAGPRADDPRRAAGTGHAEAESNRMKPMDAIEMSPGLTLRGVTTSPLRLADFRLIALDMDSTLINIECVDEIAAAAGRKAEVAAITEAAMRGEIADYKASLRQRVALLKGVPVGALEQVYRERLQLNPGAETLVRACQAAGLKTLLVSGGFTFFTDRVRDRLGLDFTRSNVLEVAEGQLTGRMIDQPWGDICDGEEKKRMLLQTCEHLGIAPAQAIAVGDGANDLPMMGAAGLSVAYHAKPRVRERAMVAIDHGGLDRLLEVVR